MIPCLCFLRMALTYIVPVRYCMNRGSANGAPAGGAFLVDIPTEAVAEVRGPDELRLLIFPQPLDGALKNQNAAPASPPCFRRRQTGCGTQHPLRLACVSLAAASTTPRCFRRWRRSSSLQSAPLLFESCTDMPTHVGGRNKKEPLTFVRGFWWSIVSSSRTFRQAYRCCGQSASNRETEALRNASALARVLFSVDIRAGQCCPADHADFGKLHSNQRRTVCRLR